MFGALFGGEMPLALRFFLAFVIVLGLIGATAWAVRRFGAGRLGTVGMRGRQPRLAVIDYASIDARRRLVLVRRDNVEHLLMIGGPSDVVVEPNIVRAAAATRDVAVARPPAAAETLPRALPLQENGSWPLAPEPMAPPRPAPRMEPEPEEPVIAPAPYEPPPRPARETLAALAEEIAARPVPPRNRPAAAGRPHPLEPRLEPRAEPRMAPVQPDEAETLAAADQSLAEMAHRLEAALRKPRPAADGREGRAPAPAARAAPPPPPPPPPPPEEVEEVQEAPLPPPPPPPPPRATRSAETRPPRAEAKTSQGKALYDSLEQEMASLLGRPAGKT